MTILNYLKYLFHNFNNLIFYLKKNEELRQTSCVENGNCNCFLNCSHYEDDYKCGSNGKDYRTECDLKHANCVFQSNITVLFQGKCGKIRKSI